MDIQKKNRIVYLFVYFVAYLLYVYINAYLPIYFAFASSIDISKLTLILLTSYSFMFTKPIFAIIVDYREKSGKKLKRKFIIIISTLLVIVSFIIIVISLELLVIFTLFLGINFAFVSILDVMVDKFIVEQNQDEKIKDRNVLYIQFGAILGSIFPNLFFVASRKASLSFWNQFFLIGIIAIIPLLPIVMLLNVNGNNKQETVSMETQDVDISIKGIVLMGVFLFFAYSKNLYEWLLEPWAITRLGDASGLFSIIMIILTIIDVISLILAVKISHKYERKHLLIISVILSGIILAIAPFLNIYLFLILINISEILSGFFLINKTTIMIDLSQKQVVIFQIMASFGILSKVIFIPLGTMLSASISTEVIIMIGGLLLTMSAIPLYLIDYKNN